MPMRALLITIFAAIPLVLIAWVLFSRTEVTPLRLAAKNTPATNRELPQNTLPARKISGDQVNQPVALPAHDNLTDLRYKAAADAAKLDPDEYRSDEKFMLDKLRSEFDQWEFSPETRRQIVAHIGNHNRELARAFRDSNLSWPLTVGDMSNVKGHLAHQAGLVREVYRLRDELQTGLEATGGERFGQQFVEHYFPQRSKNKVGR
jgi:hypothetical protein